MTTADLAPSPELPDETLLAEVRLPSRAQNALKAAGFKTVGDVREATDKTLLSLQDLGKKSVSDLRDTLGLPSSEGVRPGER
jgi:DNA-directed RNA polymerase alpha subunit